MKTPRALSISSAVGLALGVFGASAARADDCDLAASAAIAQAKVPHAATHVTNIAGASTRTEMIFTADKAYLQKDGSWRSMSYSPQAQIDRINAVKTNTEKVKQTCEKAGSETIKGEAATVLVIDRAVASNSVEAEDSWPTRWPTLSSKPSAIWFRAAWWSAAACG